MGLNCVGPLTCGFFFTIQSALHICSFISSDSTNLRSKKVFLIHGWESRDGNLWMLRANCMHCSRPLRTRRDWSVVCYLRRGPGTNPAPPDTEECLSLSFGGVKSYTQIFNHAGICAPHPPIVQGSTVFPREKLHSF